MAIGEDDAPKGPPRAFKNTRLTHSSIPIARIFLAAEPLDLVLKPHGLELGRALDFMGVKASHLKLARKVVSS